MIEKHNTYHIIHTGLATVAWLLRKTIDVVFGYEADVLFPQDLILWALMFCFVKVGYWYELYRREKQAKN